MQSTAGTNLLANAADSNAKPCHLLEIKWGNSWIDESDNLLSASGSMAISDPAANIASGGDGIASTCEIVLDNTNLENDVEGKYFPDRTDSPLYQFIKNGQVYGKDIRLGLGYYNGASKETLRQFTGNIYDIGNPFPAMKTSLVCMDYAQKVMHQRIRTPLYSNQRVDEILATLASQVNLSSTNLDRDPFIIPYWWADSESTWKEMNRLVRSVGARLYFDENGALTFENMHHWMLANHRTALWTVTTSEPASFEPHYGFDNVWDGAIVEWAVLEESYTQVVFEYHGQAKIVAPGEVKTFVAQFARPCSSVISPVGGAKPTSDSNATQDRDTRDYVFTNAGGDDMNTSVSVAISAYAQRAEVTITNNSANYAVYLRRFQLRGTPLSGEPAGEAQYNARQSTVSFPKILEVRDEELIQTESQADSLSQYLRDRLEVPIATFHLKHLPALPFIQLGDPVAIVNPVQMSVSKLGLVVRKDWQYSSAGYWMDLELLDAANLFPFASSESFIVGTSYYGGAGQSGHGRLGY